MNEEKGYIKLYRGIRENEVIWEERATRLQAWIDLLLLANYKDKNIVKGRKKIEIKRGSFISSYPKLGERWGWDRRTAKNFLELLEDEGMVSLKVDNHGIAVNIVNYCKYQGFLESDVPQNVPQDVPQDVLQDVLHRVPQNVHNEEYKESNKKEKESKRNNNTPFISPQGETSEEKPKKKKSLSPTEAQIEINKMIDGSELSTEVKNKLKEFVEYKRTEIKKPYHSPGRFDKEIEKALACEKEYGTDTTIKCLDECMLNSYQGAFYSKAYQYAKQSTPKQQTFNMDDFLRRYDDE